MTGDDIRQWRERKGLSREELALHCKVSASTVANWELNRNKPHGAALERIESLVSGKVAVVPLTGQEERLFDELIRRTGFASREEYLTARLLEAIKTGETSGPRKPAQ